MEGIWRAAKVGDVGAVEQLLGQDRGLLNAECEGQGYTPLMHASLGGHVGVVRWLLDQGAAVDERDKSGQTALTHACYKGRILVVRLLVEMGADPSTTCQYGWTPLTTASVYNHLEVVRFLLGLPGTKAIINNRSHTGETALWAPCYWGFGGVARVLLESGADPTIPNNRGITPMAAAKMEPDRQGISAEGRRECLAAFEVRTSLPFSLPLPLEHALLIAG
jgi:uncharacterized protein